MQDRFHQLVVRVILLVKILKIKIINSIEQITKPNEI